ncbi:hypothetical protein GCM10009836_14700 [Pseudonocardia ailaonensis]|uniref:4Fe-4S ferredoxin-type domain-containing protein n=1 Tax=Pseudonocardia ailaonensis TaxID=367279 RepID=A0ABN2MVI7_9PSEU
MIVDCEGCAVRGAACGDCVIGVLLGMPEVPSRAPGEFAAGAAEPGPEVPSGAPQVQLDAAERHALAVLADQGLIPRLRLVPTRPQSVTDSGGAAPERRNAV